MQLIPTAHAQTFSNMAKNQVVGPLLGKIIDAIVLPIVSGMFLVALVVFFWGAFILIVHADDPTARKEGQQKILWGVVGLLIMISVYGIVRLIAGTVGVSDPFA